MKVKGIIRYKIKETHPDKEYVVGGWNKNKIYEYSDIYNFSDDYDSEEIKNYICNDLKLVAGGGYTAKHIIVEEVEIL